MQVILPHGAAPYCGSAPTPADIASHWNYDATLIAILVIVLAAYIKLHRTTGESWRAWCFGAGWLVALLVLVTPLCSLSVALFSARVGEHMILTTVSAPLVALGRPFAQFRLGGSRPVAAAAAFAATLWFWHAPAPYDASFTSDAAFWSMQVTLYASALWFWTVLFERSGQRLAGFVMAIFLTTGQMGLLGAIITFAGRPLYSPHFATTFAWGLTPLQDQQLGGVVMWIPAGAIFAVALVGMFVEVMRQANPRERARQAKVA